MLTKASKSATLVRMALPGHVCPYGLKARHLLRRHGYAIEDRLLRTREEVEDYKAREGVATTPQIVIGGERVGGHDDLRRFLGMRVADPKATTYRPVIAVFATAALVALAISWIVFGAIEPVRTIEWFVGLTMCLLAMLKLQDVERFATMFLNYDLLAARWVPYSYAYPFLELGAGVLMVAGVLHWLSIPVALFIGGIGAVSVVKAVYLDRRELKCACVGGSSNVPLGFVSLTENLFMVGMALWMLARM